MTLGYAHLVGLENPILPEDTCVYLDGITYHSPLPDLSELVFELFEALGSEVLQVVVGEKAGLKSKARSPHWLRRELSHSETSQPPPWDTLQFFPSKRTTVEETWFPDVYVAMTFTDKENSLFFSFKSGERSICSDMLRLMSPHVEACATYVFPFPHAFSPLAYYWGIAVMPDDPRLRYGEREEKRLEYHRDNTRIGILGRTMRRFYNVCEGYVRDVYPMMILSEVHRNCLVSNLPFEEFIKPHGSLTELGNGYFQVMVEPSEIAVAQRLWDDSGLTLSAFRRTSP